MTTLSVYMWQSDQTLVVLYKPTWDNHPANGKTHKADKAQWQHIQLKHDNAINDNLSLCICGSPIEHWLFCINRRGAITPRTAKHTKHTTHNGKTYN
jgi:hypothetical protein